MKQTALREVFQTIHGREPRVFRAPGRVNLIGEHTDYNDGFVLPFAIDRETFVAGGGRPDTVVTAFALDVDETFSFDLRDEAIKGRGNWRDYVEGTARCVMKRFRLTNGADLVITSTVPIGAGLSSSAALEVSVGYALLALNEVRIDKRELAFAAQEAEHGFVGIRSGIMDQFASVLCQAGRALLLDCRSLETRHIPLELKNALLVVCDTKVKHELASSEYNARRRECEAGVKILREELPDIKSLRDVSFENFQRFQDLLPAAIKKRCRHVITENARTLAAAAYLEKGELEKVGREMYASHESLRDDYEVSCAELDKLVEIARKTKGVLGARMTGGGFGGCTINLVREDAFEKFCEKVRREYTETFGFDPAVFTVTASEGAREI